MGQWFQTQVSVNGEPVGDSELRTLHGKLDQLGALLRGSLDNFRRNDERYDDNRVSLSFNPVSLSLNMGQRRSIGGQWKLNEVKTRAI